ncbi:hypothetical protein H4R34_004939, partial [Dimargaris verticillata]
VAVVAFTALVAMVAFPSSVYPMPAGQSQALPVDGDDVVAIKLNYITLPGRRLDLHLGELHANEMAEEIFLLAREETLKDARDKIRDEILGVANQPRQSYANDPIDQTPYIAAILPLALDQEEIFEIFEESFNTVQMSGDDRNIDPTTLNDFVSELAEAAIDCIANRQDYATGFLGYMYQYHWSRTAWNEDTGGFNNRPNEHFLTLAANINAPIVETIDKRHASIRAQPSATALTPNLANRFGQLKSDPETLAAILSPDFYGSDAHRDGYEAYAKAMIAEDEKHPRQYKKRQP